ncbi:MAG: hypothetical protein H6807_11435 [Planctomycetes bacterium]|nr:hypothetical protein [Planctomycetota bacterium]
MRYLIVIAVALVLAPTVRSQSLTNLFGVSLTRQAIFSPTDVGDVDGDGCDDIGFTAQDPSQLQRAAVVSGADGSVLFEVHGGIGPVWSAGFDPVTSLPWPRVRAFHRLGDMNGDGIADYAIAHSGCSHLGTVLKYPELVIRAGGSHAVLATIPMGGTSYAPFGADDASVALIGDVTGDGVPDIGMFGRGLYLTMTGNVSNSFIDLIDGATFQRWNLVLFAGVSLIPQGLVPLGDIDGDLVPDFAIGSPAASGGNGVVAAYSGANGAPIWSVAGATTQSVLGSTFFGVGDVDGDLIPDLVAWAQGDPTPGPWIGTINVFSGVNGALLRQTLNVAPSEIAWVEAAGDVDGDGYRDYSVVIDSAGLGTTYLCEVRSGLNDGLIRSLADNTAAVGDLNGDGIGDFMTRTSPSLPGATTFNGFTLMGALGYGTAAGGPFDLRWTSGPPAPSSGYLELTGAAPFSLLVGVVSFQKANTLVPGTPLPLYVSIAPGNLHGLFYSNADSTGTHLDPLVLNQPALAGLTVYVQYGIFGFPNGVSNAVELLFGP